MYFLKRLSFFCMFAALFFSSQCFSQTREEKVRNDRKKVETEGFWIYNDLPRAFREAKQNGKPILVVLRCIPCEECVKLDDDLVDKDPVIRPLLEKFVCIRQVSTNGLDLNLFQYDTDQSFAVFMLNADGTIYGRFGTRSHHSEWIGDVSLEGLGKALQGALDLHAAYPANQPALVHKRGKPLEVASPEKYPSLKDKFTDRLNYEGNVVQSCIHCHQIGDAQRQWYRDQGKPIPEKILFPYPHPKSIGLILDPEEMATVLRVEPNSPAAQAGFLPGDRIELFNDQPMLSIADIQWVLHNIDPRGGEVDAKIIRENQSKTVTLSLTKDWRRRGDISWRVTSWGLRRMSLGGLSLEELSRESRSELKITEEAMALRVKGVGQYGPHATAKNAGFQKEDVIVSFDGRTDLLTEQAVLEYGVTARKPGETVEVELVRSGKRLTLRLPMQP